MSALAAVTQSTRARMLCLVIAVGVASVFPFLGSPSLWDFDEAFYAEISRNMAEGKDWVVPVFNGSVRFDKPPLLYWLTALWYKAFGPSELGVRIFPACFLVATCAMTFLIGERLFTARVGLLSGVILSTSALTMILGRMGLMDTGLMFFVVTAVYLLLTAGERARLARYIGSGALIGLGMLIKGPIAAFLALVSALGALGPVRFFRRLREPGLWLTALTGLAVAAPWHVLMWLRFGREFYERYFGFHQVSLLTDEMLGHGGPFYYYVVVIIVGLLPWSSVLARMPYALKDLMVSNDTAGRREAVKRLLWWFAPAFVFFSLISTKAPAYVLPVLPPFCVLLAATWLWGVPGTRSESEGKSTETEAESTDTQAKSMETGAEPTGTHAKSMETGAGPTGAHAKSMETGAGSTRTQAKSAETSADSAVASVRRILCRMAALIARTPPAAVTAVVSLLVVIALMLFRDQVPARYAYAFWFLAAPFIATAAVSVGGLLVAVRSRSRFVYLWTAAVYAGVFAIAIGYIAMPALDELKPNKPLAEFVRESLDQDVAVGSMLSGQIDASTVFYVRHHVTLLDHASEAARFLVEHEEGCLILWEQDIPVVEGLVGGRLNILASARGASVVTASPSLYGELRVLND
ncbi:MAG: glycosyltransferase family 39 protein [Firmicutes bacterium]|nr:glycosyltransferase family 39 protein [Bacillota bacterium]